MKLIFIFVLCVGAFALVWNFPFTYWEGARVNCFDVIGEKQELSFNAPMPARVQLKKRSGVDRIICIETSTNGTVFHADFKKDVPKSEEITHIQFDVCNAETNVFGHSWPNCEK